MADYPNGTLMNTVGSALSSGPLAWNGSAPISPFHLVPLWQPRIEDSIHNDLGRGTVVRMNTRALRREHIPRPMTPNEARNGETRLERVGDESILKIEREPLYAEHAGGFRGLGLADSALCIPSRFTIGEIHEQRLQPFVGELGCRPAHRDFQVVRMGGEGQYVESLIHMPFSLSCCTGRGFPRPVPLSHSRQRGVGLTHVAQARFPQDDHHRAPVCER